MPPALPPSDQTIAFYLQLEDTLSPALHSAAGNYASFVNQINQANKTAYSYAADGMAALKGLAKDLESIPSQVASSYGKMKKKLETASRKPITQHIAVELTSGRSGKAFTKGIGQAVANVLKKVTIRLSATKPLAKDKYFDMSQNLTAAYKQQTQPPDMRGRIQGIPKFATGGMVGGQKGEIDTVLSYLSPGEMVLPTEATKVLKEASELKRLPKGLAQSVAQIQSLAKAMNVIEKAAESGLDPKAPAMYEKAVTQLNTQVAGLADQLDTIPKTTKLSSWPVSSL